MVCFEITNKNITYFDTTIILKLLTMHNTFYNLSNEKAKCVESNVELGDHEILLFSFCCDSVCWSFNTK